MKKFITPIILCTALFANDRVPSNIDMPRNIFIDLDPQTCDTQCLQKPADEELFFSFLTKYPQYKSDDGELKELFITLSNTFSLHKPLPSTSMRIAVLLPHKKIGGYAISTVNTIASYLLARENDFAIEVFTINDESEDSINQTLTQIKQNDFTYLIAPLTADGADVLIKYANGLEVYVPTVNKSLIPSSPANVTYGGIDYEEQIALLSLKANEKIATFSDGSVLGKMLDTFVASENESVVYSRDLKEARIDFKRFLKDNETLQESSIFVNMPLVKASLLISQLRYNDIAPHAILSTQIAYQPMLLNLTQYEDRQNLFIANSIDFVPSNLRVSNSILGNNLEYDWVNYSTSIGIDNFYSSYFNTDATRLFKEDITNNQVKYNTKLYQAGRYQFYLER